MLRSKKAVNEVVIVKHTHYLINLKQREKVFAAYKLIVCNSIESSSKYLRKAEV